MDKTSFMDNVPSPSFGYDFADPFLQYTNGGAYGMPIGHQETSPRLNFGNLNLSSSMPEYNYSGQYAPGSATPNQRPFTPVDVINPPLTTLSHSNLSNSELSGDGYASAGKRSRETSSGRSPSPPDSAHAGLVHRQPLRGGGRTSTKERLSKRRAKSDDLDSDDDGGDLDFAPSSLPTTGDFDGPRDSRVIQKRREEIRRQRIESEQRRRDELREGYAKLKNVLPVSNQKSSKVSLLDRATLHIKYLEMTQTQLQARLQNAEMETQRLRLVNEKLMLGAAEHNQQAAVHAAHAASMPNY